MPDVPSGRLSKLFAVNANFSFREGMALAFFYLFL